MITLMRQSPPRDCLVDNSESKQSNMWEESDSCLSNVENLYLRHIFTDEASSEAAAHVSVTAETQVSKGTPGNMVGA
ncbi:hypothetical protein LEMLEM_LOCUS1669 [Lemmus lemmus]